MNGNLISSTEFGVRLHKLRERAKYETPRELALVMCGYSKDVKGLFDQEAKVVDRKRRNINNWECGKCKPSVDEVAALCNLLDCDPEYLLYQNQSVPRKETKTIAEATGLSVTAVENIIGIKEYGPTNSLRALDLILRESTIWKFFARKQEDTDDDPLMAFASYLIHDTDVFYIRSSSDGSCIEFYENDYIQPATENSFVNAKFLFDRARLDALESSLRKLKELAKNDLD